VYVSDSCLTGGEPDVEEDHPFLWVTRPANQYWQLGSLREAFSIGNNIKARP
jgi:hypothetical protein